MTTCVMRSLKIGVSLPGLPTTARMSKTTPSLLVRFEVEVRDVDAEVARAEVVGQPPPPFEVECDLTEARRKRHVEGGDRSGIEPSGRRQAVMFLEDAYGADKRLVVPVALDRVPRRDRQKPRAACATRPRRDATRPVRVPQGEEPASRPWPPRPATRPGRPSSRRTRGAAAESTAATGSRPRGWRPAWPPDSACARWDFHRPSTARGSSRPDGDIAAQPNQRGRESQVEDRQRLRAARSGACGPRTSRSAVSAAS